MRACLLFFNLECRDVIFTKQYFGKLFKFFAVGNANMAGMHTSVL